MQTPGLEREQQLYREGIRLFNAGEFFQAHEVWEELWRESTGPKRKFLQGLIQAAVALEHYRRSNPRGVAGLARSYPTKFAGLGEQFMGLNLPRFLADMQRTLAPVVSASPLPRRGEIRLDLSIAPKIVLEYEPFRATSESGG